MKVALAVLLFSAPLFIGERFGVFGRHTKLIETRRGNISIIAPSAPAVVQSADCEIVSISSHSFGDEEWFIQHDARPKIHGERFTLDIKSIGEAGKDYVPNEIIVRYTGRPPQIVTLPDDMTVQQALSTILHNMNTCGLEYAEPNYIVHTQMIPNDPRFRYQWNFHNSSNKGSIHLPEAWDVTQGSPSVVVAVIDTGVAYENYEGYIKAPDLEGTCFVAGYDYANNDSHPNDDNGHGTHVTGTIAQATNNSIGAAGVAPKTCVMPIKVLKSNGSGSSENIVKGIQFAADNGADVINMSLGSPYRSETEEDAVEYAHSKGVTIVAAAGNAGLFGCSGVAYPAAYDEYVIAVGAVGSNDQLSYYSCFGPGVDIVAPGGNKYVDYDNDGKGDRIVQNTFSGSPTSFDYYGLQGTSMASPHAAGVAALIIASGKATSPEGVRNALQLSAKDLGASGRDDKYGWGLINAFLAVGGLASDLECGDGVDNDNDSEVDYPADTGCTDARDNSESPTPQCSDDEDNDGDTKKNYPDDLGCESASDVSELSTKQCDDSLDNDSDGKRDYPNDSGCSGSEDENEYTAPMTECDNKSRAQCDAIAACEWGNYGMCTFERLIECRTITSEAECTPKLACKWECDGPQCWCFDKTYEELGTRKCDEANRTSSGSCGEISDEIYTASGGWAKCEWHPYELCHKRGDAPCDAYDYRDCSSRPIAHPTKDCVWIYGSQSAPFYCTECPNIIRGQSCDHIFGGYNECEWSMNACRYQPCSNYRNSRACSMRNRCRWTNGSCVPK